MIFVTVGTHNQSFERLVKKADEIAGKIGEKVVIQTGHTKYKPKN
ncbi:MAG: beta-1,4-galactosyltransferase, partial [Candidatus Hydrothermarchaeota archaeon]|nr:beta-1,4-galactosyltransferase [Candidatus Hydrothermarchaeota archaeon]